MLTKDSESGVMPDTKLLAQMGKFNEELAEAGVMLEGEGLHPSSKGKRVRFKGDKREIIDGPFDNPNSLLAGYWIWQVQSIDQALSWVKRIPNPTDAETEIEIRPIMEIQDLGEAFTPELREQEERLRRQINQQQAKQ